MVGSNLAAGSSVDYDSMVVSESASSAGSVLGTLAGSEFVHSATEECINLPFRNQLRVIFNIILAGHIICTLRMRTLPLVVPEYSTCITLD